MPSGPKKRRAARNKNRGNQNNGADLEGEENAFIESTSMEVQDGLAVKDGAAHVELATPVDAASSKEVVLNQNVGLKDVLELGLKENDGKEVSEHVLDLSLEEGKGKELPSEVLDHSSLGKGKEVPVEVLDSGSKENDDKPVEEDALVEPILTEVEDRLVVINDGVYIDLAEPVDALSPRGIILVQDVGSKHGKDVIDEHVLDSSLEEEGKGKEPLSNVPDSGPKENDEVKENALIEQTSVEMEDELAVKNDAANYVELAEPDEALSPRGIVFIRDVASEDVFELAGLTENDGKEVIIKEVLDSSLEEDNGKESLPPAAEALDSTRVLKVEENALIKPTSIEVEDGLAVKTTAANVELSEPIDALFSKEVVQNVGSEDVFELGSKEVDVKEVIKDVVDSSLDDAFVQDVGSEENDRKSVEENALIEPTSIDQVEDELAEPVDVFSPRGIVFVQDVGSEDVFELGSKENYGKEVSKEVLDSDSSLEEDDGKEPPAEVLDSGPILKVEENALIEPTSIDVEDGLAVKIAAADVELAEPVDAVSSKEVILVQNVGSEDVFDMGWTEIDVKEVIEDSLDSRLGEDEWKEPPAKVHDSSPMENDEKPVEQSTFIEPTLVEVEDGLVVNKKTIAADVEVSEAIDGLFSKEVVLAQNLGSEDVSELGSNEIDVKEVNEDVLDSILKEDELNETPAEVPDSGPNENGEKPVEESALIESTPVEAEDVLVVEPVTADVDELAEPVDAHSSKGVLLVQDEGFEDAFELGSNVSDETEVFEDVLDSSPEKDEGSKLPAEVRISDPKENDDKQVEENVLIKPTSIELENGLAVKTAAEDVELAEPVDAIVTKEIVLVQDVGSEDIFELGLKENNGEDVIKDVLDSSLEKDDGKEPPAEVNGSGPKKNDEKPVEEDDLTKPTSIEVENDLVVETPAANVELAEPVDALSTFSSEGVLLAKNVGSKDVFELASKEEVIEDVLDSSLKEDDGKESPSEVPETGPILKDEENTFIDPTSVKGEDGLVVKAASTDVELAESIDVLSFRGFLVQDVGSEDISELGLNEHYGGEIIKHVLDSSLEEDEQKEPHREILDSGPKENEDKPAAESAFINPRLVEVEDGLAVKIAAGDVELAEPVDNISSRGVIFVQEVDSEDVSAKENDGREVIEDVLDSSLAEDEQKEQHVEIPGSGPKENDDKSVGDSALIETTSVEMEDAMSVETAAGDVELAEGLHDISSRGVVLVQDIGSEDVLELGSEESDGKELTEDVLDSSLENDKWKEPHAEVNDIRPKENDNEPVEEDALVKTTSIELEDGLALTTAADVELTEPVDTLSNRSVLVQDGGFEDVFELGLKEKDEKEVEDVFDSSLEKDEWKEPPCEVNDSCLKENVDNPVEENAIIEPNAIKLDYGLAMTTGVDDAELAKPVDALFQDIRFEDVFELGYEENDDNPVEEDALIAPNSIKLEHGSASTTAAIDIELAGSIDALSYKGVSFVQDRGFDDSSLEKVVGKEAPVEFNYSGLKENDDKPVEEDGLIEPTSTELELEDGLGVTTASDVELAEPRDAFSSEGVVLDRDVGFEDVFEFVSKENDGKEVIQDFLDSSSKEDDGEEPPAEFLGSGPVLEVEKDALSDPTSIELELEDGLAATTAGGVELAEPVDALFSKGVVLDRDGGFEDVFELGLKKNDGKEESKDDVLNSSSEEDDEEEPPEEVLDSGSILKVLFSKYFFTLLCIVVMLVVWKQQFVLLLSTCSTGSSWSPLLSPIGPHHHEYQSMETADDVADLSEPPDTCPSKGAVLEICSKKDIWKDLFEGKEAANEVLDSAPKENEGKERAEEVIDSGSNKIDNKPVVEDPSTDELELASKETERKELTSVVGGDTLHSPSLVESDSTEDDSFLSKEVVKNVLELGSKKDEGRELVEEVLELGQKENVGQPKVEDPLADELELASDSNKTSGKEMASFLGRDPFDSPSVVSPIASVEDDTVLSREIVQNAFFKEPAEEVLDSVLNENDDKSVVEDPLTDELELESDSQEIKKKELAFVVGGDPLDSPTKDDSTDSMDGDSVVSVELNEKPCVENKVAKRNVGADGENLLALVKGVRKTIEEQLIVVEEMRASLRQLLDSVNLIRTTIQG